jgi:hypothetical protein
MPTSTDVLLVDTNFFVVFTTFPQEERYKECQWAKQTRADMLVMEPVRYHEMLAYRSAVFSRGGHIHSTLTLTLRNHLCPQRYQPTTELFDEAFSVCGQSLRRCIVCWERKSVTVQKSAIEAESNGYQESA